MPEMSSKFVPKHKGDKNPNPKLLKFVRHVTDRIPGKIKMTTDAPEYWGLACIFEDEMDAVTREASLDLLLDMLPGNFFRVREHHSYQQLHQWNEKKHYTPDGKSFDELLDKLTSIRQDTGCTIILVSHSMEDVARYADRIVVMHKGRIAFDDTPMEVFKHRDELKEMGLGVPGITETMYKLKDAGFPVSTDIITVDTAVTEIMKVLGR